MGFKDLIMREIAALNDAEAEEARQRSEARLKRIEAIKAELPGFDDWHMTDDGDRVLSLTTIESSSPKSSTVQGGSPNTFVKLCRKQLEGAHQVVFSAMAGGIVNIQYTLTISVAGYELHTHPYIWDVPTNDPPTPDAIAQIIGKFLWQRSFTLLDQEGNHEN